MAQTVTFEGLRSQIVTSIFGRRLGYSLGNSSDSGEATYLVGAKAFRSPIKALTTASTAADQIPAYGVVTFGTSTTGGTTYHSVLNPIPGASVTCVNLSTGYQKIYLDGSTGTTGVSGYFGGTSAAGFLSTASIITLPGIGSWCRLTGLTTAKWFVELMGGDTAGSTDKTSAV